MEKKVTVQAIADALGLSRNTVSKALNNKGALAEDTRWHPVAPWTYVLLFQIDLLSIKWKESYTNCLTDSNIQLGNVALDSVGKSVKAILDKLLENPADTSFDLEPIVCKRLKK